MACFIAALAESAVAYGVKKACEHHGTERSLVWAKRIGTLITMLLGGSFLLMIEHVWHGEITWFPPFLTAMNNPEDTAEMIHEILTVGVSMDVALTVSWGTPGLPLPPTGLFPRRRPDYVPAHNYRVHRPLLRADEA